MKFLRGVANRLSMRKSKENPSVQDYKNEKDLKKALGGKRGSASTSSNDGLGSSTHSSVSARSSTSNGAVEWKLALVDEKTTEPQNMEEELKRLQNLQSYFILDSEEEEEFDRITRLASQVFDAPMAFVSLVDLGREWFMSRVGTDDTESSRKHAFCAHVVLNKYKMLIVPDASKDIRFKDSPIVTGGPKVRFYAGAAIVSPEGYKLGSFCVKSPVPRPQGLNETEQQMLREMADMVVSVMVARRDRLVKAQYESKIQELTLTLADTATALESTKASIASIVDHAESPSGAEHKNALSMAANNLEVQSKICTAAARSLYEQDKPNKGKQVQKSVNSGDWAFSSLDFIMEPTTEMEQLFTSLNTVVKGFPHKAPVTMELDGSVPAKIIGEDLLLFRSSLNLVAHAMGRTEESGSIHFLISPRNDYLMFECEDSGAVVPEDKVKQVFFETESLLAPVASMVRSLDGTFGTRAGRLDGSEGTPMSIFWFRVPIDIPESVLMGHNDVSTVGKTMKEVYTANDAKVDTGKALVDDPFRAAFIQAGCITISAM